MDNRSNRIYAWAGIAWISAGLLMAVLWLVYTYVHGPTSYDQTRAVLGRSTLFWGSMLSGPPSLLVVLGLLLLYPILARETGRLARIGYFLTLVSLLVPAVIDLIFVFLSPPLLLPVLSAGLVMMSLGLRHKGGLAGLLFPILLGMGILLFASFLWALLPIPISDRLSGYRIYGFVAHLLFGLGWIASGIRLLRRWRLA